MSRAVMSSSGWQLPVAVLLLLATTGCAARANAFTSRFITEGTPSVNVGGIETPVYGQAPRAPRAIMPPVPPISSVTARPSSNLGTLEASSPPLQRALAALATQPTSERYLAVASAYLAAGVPDKAYDHLSEGLRHDKTNPALHDAVARVWRDWGFPDRALSAALAAVYYAPESPEARNTLGTVLWTLGQRVEARKAFTAATALAPDAAYAWQNLCATVLADGHTMDAIVSCQRARALHGPGKESRR